MTTTSTARSQALFAAACSHIPGGVNSPVRAMRSVGREYPIFIDRGAGAHAWDADGNEYVDWVLSWGALPLGHADPEIVEAVTEAVAGGTSFGAPTEREVAMAELVCSAVPSIEMVRFVSSGTEAMMSTLRLARAATGRDTVITFSGCYHGHSDAFLATGGSGLATLSIPSSPGVAHGAAADTLIARFNDLSSVEQLIAESGRDIAAIVLEPMPGNMGIVHPDIDFIRGVRSICDRIGALLVFDEVITGFRVAWGGAQEILGVTPDLTALGKIVGGGLPAAAFGGRRDLMELVAPVGTVYQAGTLSGNPVAMAAGLAQLNALRERDAYIQLEALGARMEAELAAAINAAGATSHCAIARQGSLLTVFHLGDDLSHAPRNFDEGKLLDTRGFACMHAGALAGGHLIPPSQYEALFGSLAHTPNDVSSLARAIELALNPELAASVRA